MTGPRLLLRCGGALMLAACLSGCAGPPAGPDPTASSPPPASPAPTASSPADAAPANLELTCAGEGSPTVVLGSGIGGSASDFGPLQELVADTTRVCRYSRAGLGLSPPWPAELDDPSAGAMADQLRATLEAGDVPGPYVVLGWSYGGIVAQAFAARHPDAVAGLVLEDAVAPELFDTSGWHDFSWAEGGRDVDVEATKQEVSELDLGDTPLIVLTQGTMEGWPEPAMWMQTQDRLATLSDNVIHLIATEAGHNVHGDAEPLVEGAVREVVEAVRSGEPLSACNDQEWSPVGGKCR